jgi:hypothetical protein
MLCYTRSSVVSRSGVLRLSSSMNTVAVSSFASEHRHKISTRTSTVYKYVKEHYPTSKEHIRAREYQGKNPCFIWKNVRSFPVFNEELPHADKWGMELQLHSFVNTTPDEMISFMLLPPHPSKERGNSLNKSPCGLQDRSGRCALCHTGTRTPVIKPVA